MSPSSELLKDRQNAIYPWFEEHGSGLIHGEDLSRFKSLMPYGKVFEIEGVFDGYVRLRYGDNTYRVKPDLLKEVPQIKYRVGDKVEIRVNSEIAEIIDVMWHQKKARPFFHVTINGKKKSNRYWESDFIPSRSQS